MKRSRPSQCVSRGVVAHAPSGRAGRRRGPGSSPCRGGRCRPSRRHLPPGLARCRPRACRSRSHCSSDTGPPFCEECARDGRSADLVSARRSGEPARGARMAFSIAKGACRAGDAGVSVCDAHRASRVRACARCPRLGAIRQRHVRGAMDIIDGPVRRLRHRPRDRTVTRSVARCAPTSRSPSRASSSCCWSRRCPVMILAAGRLPEPVARARHRDRRIAERRLRDGVQLYLDRDIDAHMQRTANRPLVTGEVSPRGALIFAWTLAVASTLWLLARRPTGSRRRCRRPRSSSTSSSTR